MAAAALTAAYFASTGNYGRLAFYCPLSIGAGAALASSLRRRPGRDRAAWLLIAASLVVFGLGDVGYYGFQAVSGRTAPFPFVSDIFYLAFYLVFVSGVVVITRGGGRDRSAVIDAAVVATGIGLPIWVFAVSPFATDASSPLLGRLVAAAYPVADIAVLGAVARLWFMPGTRTPAVRLLCAGVVPLLVSDIIYGQLSSRGTWRPGSWVDGGWLVFYVVTALAGMHPSSSSPEAHVELEVSSALPPARIGLLVLAGLVAPAMLVAQTVTHVPVAGWPIAAAFVCLTGLLLARVAGAVRAEATERARQRSAAEFEHLVSGGSDLILLLEPDGRIRYASPSSERLLGRPAPTLVGSDLLQLTHPDDAPRLRGHLDRAFALDLPPAIEVRMSGGDGRFRWLEALSSQPAPDHQGTPTVVLTSRDVSERRHLEEQLMRQALHDPLTGLANRRLFLDRVSHALSRRNRGDVAVLFVDLDEFKTVNDSLGHGAGDDLLTALADRLLVAVRAGDTVARFGGDEFAVLLDHNVETGTAQAVADRLLAAIGDPVDVSGTQLRPKASIGIASAAEHDSAEDLLRNADLAMYIAKGSGKGCHATYAPEMHEASLTRLELVADLTRGVEARELVLHYQPTTRLRNGRVIGVEALVRWAHPTRGLVSPGQFIPLAEETGLIVPIGCWVLRTACTDAASWPPFPDGARVGVAVNLSARHVSDPRVVDDVTLALAESGLPADLLTLEITETALVESPDCAVATLGRLKDLGVSLAIDDFGTGYSSLSYLRRFPLDVLKVDKSFVDGLGSHDEATGLVRAILGLAETLGLETVAEGIETDEQLAELRRLGCNVGQGFLLARPMSAPDLVALLTGRSGDQPWPEAGSPRVVARV